MALAVSRAPGVPVASNDTDDESYGENSNSGSHQKNKHENCNQSDVNIFTENEKHHWLD